MMMVCNLNQKEIHSHYFSSINRRFIKKQLKKCRNQHYLKRVSKQASTVMCINVIVEKKNLIRYGDNHLKIVKHTYRSFFVGCLFIKKSMRRKPKTASLFSLSHHFML